MSRRASVYKKENPGRPRVRFPDELVFHDSIKENDIENMHHMLRRASLQMNINGTNSAGLTPLHQAVLDGNFTAVRLLLKHGANVNQRDEDQWTPLHAACADGQANIARYLLKRGADPSLVNDAMERPIDLCDQTDFEIIRVMLLHQQAAKGTSDDEEPSGDSEKHPPA